ncbi:MAG: hypothetical protein QGI68_10500 [Pseudomonadales bacterium]|jgi:DNA-binding NarL/FixJ family response regulator|nr:hypothetical protein [Pseudomonadales bacterium]MDP7146597.1 hypothetical protein [Pseudomonadales bacterium]MDP7356921.1 hypothetical protein [Pseudomonadales bacterium]MDP7595981.1 hypothetical protein [Pseudomonadales bacterium]HJN52757.1 hypothetical protein [Pseudomonadales bacterium]|tara:strand:+ start:922 stop:1266 length:345 start_codon:yes stop_codon:yes gene_type:complete
MLILDISLDPSLRNQLCTVLETSGSPLQIYHSETTQEALVQISDHDIDIILVDVRDLPRLRKEINELLASTSLTTKIVLLESPEEIVDLEPFAHLGLETISLPLSLEKLKKVIG